MRNKYFLVPLILCGTIFLYSCKRNYVALDYTNAKGEVAQLSNLVFRFNKSLYPDSLINKWDSTDYISFEPGIQGRFRWNGPDELVFSPAQPLLPATNYKAMIKDDVLRFSKFNNIKEDELDFYTSPLQLDDAQVTWVLVGENNHLAVPQINLRFNYPIKVEDLKEKFKIDIEGIKTNFSIQNIGTSNSVTIRLNGFKGEDKNYEANITIDAGLKPEKGQNSTKDPIKTVLSIPSPYVLNINNVESEHDGTEGLVHIYTSQQLGGQAISNFIKFSPDVSYTVQ
jgi:hypothetical protein